jgi:hypothetical protein
MNGRRHPVSIRRPMLRFGRDSHPHVTVSISDVVNILPL